MGWELLEHTADVGLRIWAPTLDELFAEGGRGLVGVMGRAGPGARKRMEIEVASPDLEALLVDWLSELLYVFEVKGIVPDVFDVHVSVGPWRVAGWVAGPDAGAFEQDGPAVKAVTYHLLCVEGGDGGYEARVYLDI